MASTGEAESSFEIKVFRKNFAYLKDGLKNELDAFVPLLYEKDLVTEDKRDKALATGTADINKRTIDLLTAIECQVKTNPNAFSSFLGVLKSVPALRHLAYKLEGDYDHMVKPPLDSYSAETPTDPCGSQLVAPLEADNETEKTEVCQRTNGAATMPPSSSTMQPSACVPPHSTQLDTKPSEPDVHFFFSPTPETSHESRSDIVGGSQPLAENGQPPRHSMSVPGGASTRTSCVTQPEFRREFKSRLKDLDEFVTASYSQKEEELEAKSTELAQTSNEVQRQSEELYQLVIQLEEAEHQHKEDEAEIHSYQEELRQMESQHEKEKEHLENQLLAKTKEYERMIMAVSQLAERCNELDQRLKSERKEHKQEMQQLEQEVDSLKLENVRLGEKNVSLCETNTSLCEEVKQKEADVRQKKMEIESLKQRLASIDSEFSKQQDEIQMKIEQKKCISRSRLNSADLLDIEARMKQSVSQLSVFVENEDPALKKLISDIQQLFQVYDRKMQRSISWPSSLCNLPSLAKWGVATQDL